MEKIINNALGCFEYKERNKEENGIYVLADNAPESLRESVRLAHGDRMPSDWIYCKFFYILEALRGYTIDSMDDVDENRHEIVDGLVDVYTSNLTAWLASHIGNVEYITEAQEEYGAQMDGSQLLMMAQYKAINEIFSHVSEYLQGEKDAQESIEEAE